MVALRSRRLETLFGVSLNELRAEHVHGLVISAIQEAFDLDFKKTLYGRTDSDKRALAGDVAAMANTAGGIILLGVEEDDQARAVGTPGVKLSDGEVARIHQVVASLVAPLPAFDVFPIPATGTTESETKNDTTGSASAPLGFLAIAIPRSPGAPHAVLVNDALRYPKRNGSTTRYLSEPEVATAYRDRLATAHRQGDRAEEAEQEAKDRLDTTDLPWLLISLVPDLPGDLTITRELYSTFQAEIMSKQPCVVPYDVRFYRARVGRRRLLADGTANDFPLAKWALLELHTDGSGVFGLVIRDWAERDRRQAPIAEGEPRQQLIDDESIAIGIVSGLLHLARHARDRAAAGGNALVRAQLLPITQERPTKIGHTRAFGGVGHADSRTYEPVVVPPAPGEAVAPLEDIAEPSPSLVATAAILLDELGQAFGVPEMGQLSRDGRIRRRHWNPNMWWPNLTVWAEQHGIEVTDETV